MPKVNLADRRRRFEHLKTHKPSANIVLTAKNSLAVTVWVDARVGHSVIEGVVKRLMFCNAIIDDEVTGWYLTNDLYGLKCLILPDSQQRLVDAAGGKIEGLSVKSLRVVRTSLKGTSLMCELVEEDE